MAHCNSYQVVDDSNEPELPPDLPEGAEEELEIEDEDAVEDLEVDDDEDVDDGFADDLEAEKAEDEADELQEEVEPKSIVQ